MESNNYDIPKAKLGLIKFFLLILIIEITFICYNQYQNIYNTEIFQRSLIVNIENTNDLDKDYSDSIQISNAIENGGMIFINLDSNWLDGNFDLMYSAYGATDNDDMFYILGGILNYIASEGWALEKAPTSGLNSSYYFTKEIIIEHSFFNKIIEPN
jgi:hypothetical protein